MTKTQKACFGKDTSLPLTSHLLLSLLCLAVSCCTDPRDIVVLSQIPQFFTKPFHPLSMTLLRYFLKVLSLSFKLEFHRTSLRFGHLIFAVAIVRSVWVFVSALLRSFLGAVVLGALRLLFCLLPFFFLL
uniref:Uncharacterized protein n=1 Tax=Trieres chinensis TaxID=1514140 RepID=A0A6U1U3Q0_TRICV